MNANTADNPESCLKQVRALSEGWAPKRWLGCRSLERSIKSGPMQRYRVEHPWEGKYRWGWNLIEEDPVERSKTRKSFGGIHTVKDDRSGTMMPVLPTLPILSGRVLPEV